MARTGPCIALGVAAAASAIDALRSLRLAGFRYLDEDVAAYWYAAQEFAHLRFREPCFYGQSYNQMGESLLAAPLIRLGLPPWIVLVGISVVVGLLPWVVLAWLAWRRRLRGLAVLFLGSPVFFPAGYLLLLSRFFGIGLLFVSLGLLAADSMRLPARWFLLGLMCGLGTFAIYNAAVLAAVALAWIAARDLRGRRAWALLVAGLASAAILWALSQLFYVLHPGWIAFKSPSLHVDASLLFEGLNNLSRHLGRVTPSVLFDPAVLLIALLGVAGVGMWRRCWPVVIAVSALLGCVLAILTFNKTYDGSASVFFAYERMFLGVPLGLGVVALACADAGLWPPAKPSRTLLACAIAVLAVAIPKEIGLERETSREFWNPLAHLAQADLENVRSTCARLASVAQKTGTDLVIFPNDATYAYGCGALEYGRLTTLYPAHERRTWLLIQEKNRTRDVLLLAGVQEQATCAWVTARVSGSHCEVVDDGAVVIRFGPGSALELAERIGVNVRPFSDSGS